MVKGHAGGSAVARGQTTELVGGNDVRATWRRAVRALAGGYCAPSRATFRERGIHGNFFGEYVERSRGGT